MMNLRIDPSDSPKCILFNNSNQFNPAPCKMHLRARAISRTAFFVFSLIGLSAVQSRAQLLYDHTTFLHGFASDSSIWTTTYSDLGTTPPGYLSRTIDLMSIGRPSLNPALRFNGLVSQFGTSLIPPGHYVIVAHSLGSLVARGTYIDNPSIQPDVAAIIAVTAPHQGAPLADNFVELRSFLADMQRRIEDGIAAASVEIIVANFVLTPFLPRQISGLGPALFGFLLYKVNNSSINFSNLNQFDADSAFKDLKPASATIAHLNNSFADGAIPRANVYATIPFRNAALRLYSSAINNDAGFPGLVSARDMGQTAFSVCKWAGYVTIVMWTAGRRCAYARKTLGRLDDRWAKGVNGWDQYGNTRYVPFDGVVPNEDSHYPSTNGVAFEADVNLINHLNVYKTQAGLNQVGNAMARIGMHVVGGPPPGAPNIAGPSSIDPEVEAQWQGSASGGTSPFSYQWSVDGQILQDGTNPNFSYTSHTPNSGFDLQLQVTDQAGVAEVASLHVNVSSGCAPAIIC